MKSGANFTHQNQIRKMATQGLTAEEISDALQIELKCIKSFMPEGAGGLTADQKTAITELAEAGNNAEEIADDLELSIEAVSAFMETLE